MGKRNRQRVSENPDRRPFGQINQEKMILFEFAKVREGAAEESFKAWFDGLGDKTRGAMFERFNTMQQSAPSMFTAFAHGPISEGGVKYKGIYKMKFGGIIEYRPMLCRGPAKKSIAKTDVTMLCGAEEHDGKLDPPPSTAVDLRDKILNDPSLRRRLQLQNPKNQKWLN